MSGRGNTDSPSVDLSSPALFHDPFMVFRSWRDQSPLFEARLGSEPVWVMSRYEDVKAVLEAPESRMRPAGGVVPSALGAGAAARMWTAALSMMDPPDHGHVRRLVGHAFTWRRAQDLRARIDAVVNEVLDGAARRNSFDVVSEIALPVPMRVICDLLGVPRSDWGELQRWTPDFLRIFVPEALTAADLPALDRAAQNFMDYFGAMVDSRLVSPREDLITDLSGLLANGSLSRDQLIGALRGLLTAGFETTAATISAGFLSLADCPQQLELLRLQPEVVPGAVEEFLRWESPVRAQMRRLGEPGCWHGRKLDAGTPMLLMLGAANHDPGAFREPDRVDLQRRGASHVSFGGGRHFCLGAHLARIELQSVFLGVARRFGAIRRSSDAPTRRQSLQFPSIERLVVSVH